MRKFFYFCFSLNTLWAYPEFEKSMLAEDSLHCLNKLDLITLKRIYDQNNYEIVKQFEKPRIPKIIHQIWLGPPMPEKFKRLTDSWKKYHPDWTYILWTEKEADALFMINKELYQNTKNWAMKADILRLELLYQFGGLYVDTDFECLKSFDILHQSHDFYCGLSSIGVINNALIGSCPKHPIIEMCIQKLKARNPHAKGDPAVCTGPHFMQKILLKYLKVCPENNICIYPSSFFYPFPYMTDSSCRGTKVASDFVHSFIKEESFGVHYWAASWLE